MNTSTMSCCNAGAGDVFCLWHAWEPSWAIAMVTFVVLVRWSLLPRCFVVLGWFWHHKMWRAVTRLWLKAIVSQDVGMWKAVGGFQLNRSNQVNIKGCVSSLCCTKRNNDCQRRFWPYWMPVQLAWSPRIPATHPKLVRGQIGIQDIKRILLQEFANRHLPLHLLLLFSSFFFFFCPFLNLLYLFLSDLAFLPPHISLQSAMCFFFFENTKITTSIAFFFPW